MFLPIVEVGSFDEQAILTEAATWVSASSWVETGSAVAVFVGERFALGIGSPMAKRTLKALGTVSILLASLRPAGLRRPGYLQSESP